MSRWIFEPGHTEAEFRARHMMVTWVRGLFKDIHGAVELDWDRPLETTFHGEIDATRIWTGEETRDAHLRSPDFFDVQHHPEDHPAGDPARGLPRPVGDALLGGRGEPRHPAADRLRGHDHDQPPRLRRVVAGPSARWRRGGQQRGRGLPGRGGDPRGGPGAHWRDPVLPRPGNLARSRPARP